MHSLASFKTHQFCYSIDLIFGLFLKNDQFCCFVDVIVSSVFFKKKIISLVIQLISCLVLVLKIFQFGCLVNIMLGLVSLISHYFSYSVDLIFSLVLKNYQFCCSTNIMLSLIILKSISLIILLISCLVQFLNIISLVALWISLLVQFLLKIITLVIPLISCLVQFLKIISFVAQLMFYFV